MVPPGLDFFALTFALFKAGVVPVLIDPGDGPAEPGPVLSRGRARGLHRHPQGALAAVSRLGTRDRAAAHPRDARPSAAWPTGIKTLDDLRRAGKRHSDRRLEPNSMATPSRPTRPAAILFTSGSTGPPKGAVYTHGIFAAQVELLRDLYGIEPGEIDLCTFPLFALFAPALGMTAIIPEMDATRPAQVDPAKIVEAIEDFGVTNLFGSPALLRRSSGAIGDWQSAAAADAAAGHLRRCAGAGGGPGALAALLDPPGVRSTRPTARPRRCRSPRSAATRSWARPAIATDRGAGVCVGRPVRGIEARIIRISDEPIPDLVRRPARARPARSARSSCQGPVVTREYFNRPEATALAKIADPARTDRSTTAWATSAISTSRAGSGSAGASRTG